MTPLRLGTRGSALAIVQAELAVAALAARGIESTEVWPWLGSRRTSSMVSLWGGLARSKALLALARLSEPIRRNVCGAPS